MSNAKVPATSFEFVTEWFERTIANAERLGKLDSAALWRDGLQHLNARQQAMQGLANALKDVFKEVDSWDVGVWNSEYDPVFIQARAALEAAKPLLKEQS